MMLRHCVSEEIFEFLDSLRLVVRLFIGDWHLIISVCVAKLRWGREECV